jgi:hypothetical protein
LLSPILYAGVELGERAPVLLSLPAAPEDCTIEPESLGYFVEGGGFVYTADVARGVIYGRALQPNGPAFVIEVVAPMSDQAFFENDLQRIRDSVSKLNALRNKLLRDAASQPEASPAVAKLLEQLWDEQAAILDAPPEPAWLARAGRLGRERREELLKALSTEAGRRARLKGLYYAMQEARAELVLRQYDLQLELSRLPKRSGPQLLPKPAAAQIAQASQAGFDALARAWRAREAGLNARVGAAQAKLTLLELAPAPAGAVSMVPQDAPPLTGIASLTPPPPAPSASQLELERAALQAWSRVANAELESARYALQVLSEAKEYIAKSAGQAWEALPKRAVATADMATPALGVLGLADVDTVAADPALLAAALLKLDRLYEGGRGKPGPPEVEQRLAGIRPRGQEVRFGLLAIDRCAKHAAASAPLAAPAGSPPGTLDSAAATVESGVARQVMARLDSMMADPDAYGVAALDLGYLRFMRWYAGLVSQLATPLAGAPGGHGG